MSVAQTREADETPRGSAPRSETGPRSNPRLRDRLTHRLTSPAAIVTVIAFACYATDSLTRHAQYFSAGYDLGIFDQAVNHYAHFRAPVVALKGPDFNLLGDHFHPILALLAPLYWIWADPRMLLLAQAALAASSIPVVYRIAARMTSPRIALAWTVAYALGWPLQSLVDFDVHEVAFAVPILAFILDALERRDDRRLLVWCLLLLLVREDMGAVIACVGLIRALQHRPAPARRWRGVALVVGGLVALAVISQVVLPALSPDGRFAYWSYDSLGPNAPDALAHLVLHPLDSARVFFTPGVKSQTLAWLFAPLLLLSLRSPYVITVLPLLAQRFFSSRDPLWTVYYHYSAPAWPLLVIAALDGARRLGLFAPGDRRRAVAGMVTAVVVAVPVVGTFFVGTVYPFHRLTDASAFDTTDRERAFEAVRPLIPADTCVEVDNRLVPHLTQTNLVSVPGLLAQPPDLVVLDLSQSQPGYLEPPTSLVLTEYLEQGYRMIGGNGPVVVLQRPGYSGPSAACGPLGSG